MQATDSPRLRRRLATAANVAEFFLNLPDVQDVYLFGSLARNEVQRKDSDVDLVIVTHHSIANRFRDHFSAEESRGPSGAYDMFKAERADKAIELLGTSWSAFWRQPWASPLLPYALQLDLFLFPDGWTYWSDDLQAVFGASDPNFMDHVIYDALRYDPESRKFVPPSLSRPR